MTEQYKLTVIKSLSELLPPFAESVMGLLNYVKENKDYNVDFLLKLAEINSHSRKVTNSLSDELTKMQEILNLTRQEENKSTHANLEKDISFIKNLVSDALDNVTEGVAIFLYLIAEEKGKMKALEDKKIFDEFLSGKKSADLNVAIDNMYQGAKKITEIIDLVIDD